MTDEEILYKVIKKAEKNGFRYIDSKHKKLSDSVKHGYHAYLKIEFSVNDVIFSHDFAKAFFNCKHKCKTYISGAFFDKCKMCGEIRPLGLDWYTWKNRLQQLVLEKEPLRYLEKFL